MTSERARQLIQGRSFGGSFRYAFHCGFSTGPLSDDGITRDEYHFILSVWERLPGYTSFYDAVCEIANNWD